jgi:hypothetical protein
MKKFLFALVAALSSAVALAATPNQTCFTISNATDYLAQATNGQMSLNGQICTVTNPTTYQVSEMTWNGTLSFHNFAPPNAHGFLANGALTFALDENLSTGALSVTYNGPVTYTYQGQTFNVVFNNLTISLKTTANGISASSVTGSLTLNGVSYPADSWVWNYLF